MTDIVTTGQVRVQDNIPPLEQERRRLKEVAARYVRENRLSGPLSLGDLRRHCQAVEKIAQAPEKYREYLAVLLNNEVWRPMLGAVPFDRRLLLLPQCLRHPRRCTAKIDHLGLNCRLCGQCAIGGFVQAASRLGYIVLVAEGSALVMSLIASGKVQAVVGVSCLGVLQKVFPYMEAAAVPGVAIPLLADGCRDTAVDADWVWDAIHLVSEHKGGQMNLERLQDEVASWFTPRSLEATLRDGDGQTHRLAAQWLSRGGKRWRPFLAACVFQSLQDDASSPLPIDFRKIAVAVECFHKASLIHDDIEDKDEFRYGQKTLHEQYGVPIALNVGDLLLGQGYRMIAQCEAPPAAKAAMLAAASRGHCELCAGQGAELCWMADPTPLSVSQVVEIFRQKTSPAFDVALNLGALYAGANGEISRVLGEYSRALGIAYQIHDDLEDGFITEEAGDAGVASDLLAMRPSILLAIAYERASGADRELLEAIWRRGSAESFAKNPQSAARETRLPVRQVERIFAQLEVRRRASELLEQYKSQAIAALAPLEHVLENSSDKKPAGTLKTLLHRVVARIFNIPDAMQCCKDQQEGEQTSLG